MDEKESPVVSVIIPNFNRGSLITETITSVIQQTYLAWEAIIVDDGSTDNSVTVVRKFQENDSRIKLIVRNRLPKGAPTCRNIGLENSSGRYVMFLDSDDLIKESCLESRLSFAFSNPHLDFLVFSCLLFKEHTNDTNILWNVFTEENDLDRFLKLDVPWQTAAVLYKKSTFEKYGNWDESLLSFQDWELAVRMLTNNAAYQKFNIHDCFWRMPKHNTIGLESVEKKEHFQSHERLFVKVSKSLSDLNLYNDKRKLNVAGLFFWLSEMCLRQGVLYKPYFLFMTAYRFNLMPFEILIQGFVYFTIFRVKSLRVRSKNLIKKFWPTDIQKMSKTFRKIPLKDGQ
jgi:glycosyltransferase involved in cell wall biosynthesis